MRSVQLWAETANSSALTFNSQLVAPPGKPAQHFAYNFTVSNLPVGVIFPEAELVY